MFVLNSRTLIVKYPCSQYNQIRQLKRQLARKEAEIRELKRRLQISTTKKIKRVTFADTEDSPESNTEVEGPSVKYMSTDRNRKTRGVGQVKRPCISRKKALGSGAYAKAKKISCLARKRKCNSISTNSIQPPSEQATADAEDLEVEEVSQVQPSLMTVTVDVHAEDDVKHNVIQFEEASVCDQLNLNEPEAVNQPTALNVPEQPPPTPKEKAHQLMRENELSPTKAPLIAQHLTAFNTLSEKVKQAPTKVRISLMSTPVRGNVGSSRCASLLARQVGVNRQNIFSKRPSRAAEISRTIKIRSAVVNFLKHPENSTCMPSKKDQDGMHAPTKYALNNTITHLHRKYIAQDPEIRVSRAVFARHRPSYIKTIKYAARRQCLCSYHQNGQLKLKAMKIRTSVDVFLATNTDADISQKLNELPAGSIKYSTWQRETISSNESVMKKMKLRECQVDKEEFIEIVTEEFKSLREHIRRNKTQYLEIHHLKQTLIPLEEITCQMDFAENYQCSFQDEPSQVFYDRKTVTLHPMVIHYIDGNGNLQHKSYIAITDEKKHFAGAVFAFLRKLIPLVLDLLPTLKTVHYVTDSPTSQYRNKFIAHLVASHEFLLQNVSCTWEFLESGHGRGPCDGIGGSIKASAAIAVKKGQIINDARSFFQWAQSYEGVITPFFVTEREISMAETRLNNANPCKGIASAHSLRPCHGFLHIRDTSCFKPCCRHDELNCPGWSRTNIRVPSQVPTEDVQVPSTTATDEDRESSGHAHPGTDVANDSQPIQETSQGMDVQETSDVEDVAPAYSDGDTVEIVFKKKTYVCEVITYSREEKLYNVKFMKKTRVGKYVWPSRQSDTWVEDSDITRRIVLDTDGFIQS